MDILLSLKPKHIAGLSLLGGDPLMPYNIPDLIDLCLEAKQLYPDKTIWIYSGYTFEQILEDENKLNLVKLCDVLVDGKYVEKLYSPMLKFRGSSNQRVIDIQESLKQNKVVLHCD